MQRSNDQHEIASGNEIWITVAEKNIQVLEDNILDVSSK